MGKWDYYAVLGLGRDATTEEVKAVYRQLARTFHPDANVDAAKAEDFAAAEHFKKITEAYTVLSDPEKRALYDHYGESWREAKKKGRRSPAPSRARPRGLRAGEAESGPGPSITSRSPLSWHFAAGPIAQRRDDDQFLHVRGDDKRAR